MDLTKAPPRSVKERFAGLVMLGRTTDKARADLRGSLGEYHYNCVMDRAVFGFLNIDHERYQAKARELDDAALEGWVRRSLLVDKPAEDVERWNSSFLSMGPEPGSDGEAYFLELRSSLDPSRTDITSWADLLDLDEGRPVARPTTA